MELIPFGTVLVGPNALLREGLTRILNTADFKILASACCVDDLALSSLPQEQTLLLIIDVGDDFDVAIAQIDSFKRTYPAGRVAVLAHQRQLPDMVLAFRAGANAYFVDVATCEAFIKSLELVMLGETLLPPAILTLIFDRQKNQPNERDSDQAIQDSPDVVEDADTEEDDEAGDVVKSRAESEASGTPRLSARQSAILRCLIDGDSNKLIARKMSIAEATVKVHVKAILRRIHVHNRTQAAIWAMNSGLFIQAKDLTDPVTVRVPIQPANLDVAQVLSSGHLNGTTQTLKLNGASHVALSSIDQLAQVVDSDRD